MNFLLDGMLGKLARWLRMMGHDTLYSTTLSDAELLALAKKENRILLTRDFALYQQAVSKGVETYYVEGANEAEHLTELADRFGLAVEIDLKKSGCPKCNTHLAAISKEQIKDKVQENTLTYYNEFWLCPNCGAVYWQGAHWTKIRATLEDAKQEQKKKK